MNCQCGKEITSSVTGNLCTSCFFRKGKTNVSTETRPESVRASAPVSAAIRSEPESTKQQSTIPNRPIPIDSPRPEQFSQDSRRDNPNSEIYNRNDGALDSITSKVEQPETGDNSESPRNEQEPQEPVEFSSVNRQGYNSSIKLCQSCIERGYPPKPATREWTSGYFICDECFQPLFENIIRPNEVNLNQNGFDNSKLDSELPILSQFYEMMEIPEALRFTESDTVLNKRNDIFNFHAPAIVNKDVKQIASEIEQMQVMLFQIKVAIEPRQDYINRLKASEREAAQLEKVKKSTSEITKSKVKLTQDQKMADTLFKATIKDPAERLAAYLKLQKGTEDLEKARREKEFNKIIGKE